MGKYTLKINGEPIEGAAEVLEALGYHVRGSEGGLVVAVDAPTMDDAEAKVRDELPSIGSYTISRPEALEDDED